ncbi:acyl carrier protein [Hirschia baltica]|uniref:Carrier domain-containing protein n=1 Tax=Hirschia baltica (strain ATCC 49814 / DSM 5838 / IFAM 1418) TaxID=582402 RepID=C6XMT9_HIRBI|nr:acyl carrier protein [Hirschia baltica]ACT60003.1 hypothetical protein Hbal_2323 [Hirschia baltica ATCC 49814]
MNINVEETVLAILKERGPLPKSSQERANLDYIEAGLVDSLGLMNLVTELESALDIELEEEDFMQDKFRTIGGLIETLQQAVARA